MKKQVTKTLAEIEESLLIEKLNRKRVELILEYLNVCNLKPHDLCAHIDMSMSTYFRYKNYSYPINIQNYSMACIFFTQYMKEYKIPNTPRLLELIDETNLNRINEITYE